MGGGTRKLDGLKMGAGLTWVWTMTRMTLQYFFMAAKSFWSCFLPLESRHLLQALVKAFFLLLCLSHTQRAQAPAGELLHRPACLTLPAAHQARALA